MPFKNLPPYYNVWAGMHDRCRNPKNRQWNDYGGRGIKVCDRWKSYRAFADDMRERPEGYTLDRIDNDGDYTPENCRWASRKTQQRNQRRAVYVEIEGKRYRAIELAELAGVKTDTIKSRAERGLPYSQVISHEPLRNTDGLSLGGIASGDRQRAKTQCPHGHEYTEENTIISRQGWRRCRQCFYAKEKRRRLRKVGFSSS